MLRSLFAWSEGGVIFVSGFEVVLCEYNETFLVVLLLLCVMMA